MLLASLNALPVPEAHRLFLSVCGSQHWAAAMTAARRFATPQALIEDANVRWLALAPTDWLQAFAAHPRIGETKPVSEQSAREQSGMAAATPAQREEFARLNAEYEARFGHIFLICATGKSAAEMLEVLRARLQLDSAMELANASIEQAKIIRLRLHKLIDGTH